MFDVIIIGGGPAGLTAGIYTTRAGLKTLVLEKEVIGGQIASSPKVENYPGFISISGAELANHLFEQVTNLGADFEIEEVKEIKDGKVKEVITDENTYQTKAIIIATGAKYRLLNLPKENQFIGKGIHFCTTCDGAFYKGKTVAIIGGANTAVTNAIYMADIAEKVYLIYRKGELRCDELLKEELQKKANVEVIYNANVKELKGDSHLNGIVLDNKAEIKLDGIFVSIGMDAETSVVKKIISLNDSNYILADNGKTNKEGIYAAGDCTLKEVKQFTTAVYDGTIAATNVINYLKTLK